MIIFGSQVLARGASDTIPLDRYSRIFQSQRFFAVSNRPDKEKCMISVILFHNLNGRYTFSKTGKNKLDFPFCGVEYVSLSDSGPMIVSCLDTGTLAGSSVAQYVDLKGNWLWNYHYYESLGGEHREMLLSPDGMYAIMSNADTCLLFSGVSGKVIHTVLETEVKGNYTAFFDHNSKVIVITDAWRIIKFDPVVGSIVQEKNIDDPARNRFKLSLNRQYPDEFINTEKNLFTARIESIIQVSRITKDSCRKLPMEQQNLYRKQFREAYLNTRDGLIAFGEDLKTSKFWETDGEIMHEIVADNRIMVSGYYKNADSSASYETRIYCPSRPDSVDVIKRPDATLNSFAFLRIGDEIIYPHYMKHGGASVLWRYNLRGKNLIQSKNNRIDSSDVTFPFFIRLSE